MSLVLNSSTAVESFFISASLCTSLSSSICFVLSNSNTNPSNSLPKDNVSFNSRSSRATCLSNACTLRLTMVDMLAVAVAVVGGAGLDLLLCVVWF